MNSIESALVGIALGTVAGLVPGLHVNTIAFAIAQHPGSETTSMVVLLVSATVAQYFSEWIPSIFLGAPEETTSLSLLPSQRLVLEGKAGEAMQQALNGSVVGTLLALLLGVAFVQFSAHQLPFIQSVTGGVLAYCIIVSVWAEKRVSKKAWSVFFIFCSALLGFEATRYSGMAIFPLMAGLFGSSQSLYNTLFPPAIPEQEKEPEPSPIRLGDSMVGGVAGSVVGLLPSMTVSQSLNAMQSIRGKWDSKRFVFVSSVAIASSNIFSFAALYSIGVARTGSAAAIQSIAALHESDWTWIASTVLFSAGFCYAWTKWLSKNALPIFVKAPKRALNAAVFAFTGVVSLYFTGWAGFGIWATASALGIACISGGIRRSSLMACLTIPTIAWYWGMG